MVAFSGQSAAVSIAPLMMETQLYVSLKERPLIVFIVATLKNVFLTNHRIVLGNRAINARGSASGIQTQVHADITVANSGQMQNVKSNPLIVCGTRVKGSVCL